jgi:hypothetical protein
MNNTPFPITPLQDNKFMLSWPRWQNIKHFHTKKKLLDVLFDDIGSEEVGISISIVKDELDIMWITWQTWAQDVNGDYATYLEDMYEIKGVAFNSENEAIKLQDYLEKKYIWKTLQL